MIDPVALTPPLTTSPAPRDGERAVPPEDAAFAQTLAALFAVTPPVGAPLLTPVDAPPVDTSEEADAAVGASVRGSTLVAEEAMGVAPPGTSSADGHAEAAFDDAAAGVRSPGSDVELPLSPDVVADAGAQQLHPTRGLEVATAAAPGDASADVPVDGTAAAPVHAAVGRVSVAPPSDETLSHSSARVEVASPVERTTAGTAEATSTATVAVASATAGRSAPTVGDDQRAQAVEPVDAPAPQPAQVGAYDSEAPATQGAAPTGAIRRAAEPVPSTALGRVLDAVEAAENAPPPHRVTVELPELEGLRLQIAVRGHEVTVAVLGQRVDRVDSDALMRELHTALGGRGFSMTDQSSGDGDERQPRHHEHPDRDRPADRPANRRPQQPSGLQL